MISDQGLHCLFKNTGCYKLMKNGTLTTSAEPDQTLQNAVPVCLVMVYTDCLSCISTVRDKVWRINFSQGQKKTGNFLFIQAGKRLEKLTKGYVH